MEFGFNWPTFGIAVVILAAIFIIGAWATAPVVVVAKPEEAL